MCDTVQTLGSFKPPWNHSRVSSCRIPHVTHKTLRLTKGEGGQKKWGRVRKGITLFHFYFVSTRVKIKTYKLIMKLK